MILTLFVVPPPRLLVLVLVLPPRLLLAPYLFFRRRHLCDDLEEKVVRSLREEVANFSMVHNQMLERSNMKVCFVC